MVNVEKTSLSILKKFDLLRTEGLREKKNSLSGMIETKPPGIRRNRLQEKSLKK